MFHKKFIEEDVVEHLSKKPMTLFEIRNAIGCKERTAQYLIKSLIEKNLINRRNRSHPNKPVWEYFILDGLLSIKPKTKEKKISNMKILKIK